MAIRLGKLKINRLWLLVGMALLLGLLATWLSVTYLRSREEAIQADMAEQAKGVKTVTVVVPTQDLKKGAVLTETVVAGRDIAVDMVFADTVLADDFDAIKGKPLLRPVERGRPITREDVIDNRPTEFSRLLTQGMRALTVDIDELNSIAQMVRPGDFIDLNFITADSGATNGGQQIFPLLQHVKVIATGTRTQGMAVDPTMTEDQREALIKYSTVTVEVTPEEAGYIALAQATGRMRMTLRPPTDEGVRGYAPVTTAQLSGGPARVAGAKTGSGGGGGDRPAGGTKVEYILGGGGAPPAPININVPGLPGFPAAGGAPAAGTPSSTGGLNLNGLPPSAGLALGNAISQANPNAPRQ